MQSLAVENRRKIELELLWALFDKCDAYNGVITPDLFTEGRTKAYAAIKLGPDHDPVGLYQAGVDVDTVMDIVNPDQFVGPDGVGTRIAILREEQQRARLAQVVGNVQAALHEWSPVERIMELLRDSLLEAPPALEGMFSKVHRLSDAVPLHDDPVEAVVRKVLYPGGMTTIAGPGGLGKSWLAISMALEIARGEFWLGFLVGKARRVLYLSLEMPGSAVRQRIKMLTRGKFPHEAQERFMYLGSDEMPDRFNTEHDGERLAAFVKSSGVEVVFVDPLRKATDRDENDASDMTAALKPLERLGCAVVLTHHVSKGSGETRGSTALRDACDAVLTLSRTDAESEWMDLVYEKRPRFEAVPGKIRVRLVPGPELMEIQREQDADPWDGR